MSPRPTDVIAFPEAGRYRITITPPRPWFEASFTVVVEASESEEALAADPAGVVVLRDQGAIAATAQERLQAVRAEAEVAIAAAIDARSTQLVGHVPQIEKDSWPSKEVAARTIVDPNLPDPAHDLTLLETEAMLRGKGETALDLAVRIIANADTYRMLISAFSALRASAFEALGTAGTLEAVAEARAAALARVQAVGAAP